MGNGHSSSPDLSLVTSAHVVHPAFSNIVESYPVARTGLFGNTYYDDAPALLQTTFGREGPETISVVRDLNWVYKGWKSANVETLSNDVIWPNEAELVPAGAIRNADPYYTVISSQGFFPRAPGTGYIALYDVTGLKTTITKEKEGFFYHVARFHDMNKDGRLDVVTARTRVPFVPAGPTRMRPDVPNAQTELLWLEQPVDGALTQGWDEHIINRGGAGVTFDLVDMDNNGEMQIMTAEFFQGQKLAIIECPEQNWLECSGQDEDGELFNEDKLNIVVVNQQAPALPPCFVVPPGTPCDDSIPAPPAGGPPTGGLPPCSVVPAGTPCDDGSAPPAPPTDVLPPCSVVPAGTPCSTPAEICATQGKVFDTCGAGASCQPTCGNPSPICATVCIATCECPPGTILSAQGGPCVDPAACSMGGPPTTGGPPTGGPPTGGPPTGGPPCWALPFGTPPGTPCVEGIPQPRRFFNAELVDLNNDGKMDILATSSPHVVNGEGKMWAFEQPLSGNWRFGPWRSHILSEGPQYALNAAQNGSPGDAHAFFPCLDSHKYCKYDIELPSILLSGDDAGYISVFTPLFDDAGNFNFEYSEEKITEIQNPEEHTMGSPAVRYNSRGFAEFVVPKYSDNTIEFWTYDPAC